MQGCNIYLIITSKQQLLAIFVLSQYENSVICISELRQHQNANIWLPQIPRRWVPPYSGTAVLGQATDARCFIMEYEN